MWEAYAVSNKVQYDVSTCGAIKMSANLVRFKFIFSDISVAKLPTDAAIPGATANICLESEEGKDAEFFLFDLNWIYLPFLYVLLPCENWEIRSSIVNLI